MRPALTLAMRHKCGGTTRPRHRTSAHIRVLHQRARKEGVGAYEVAFIDRALGKKDEGFRWLDVAYEQHDPGLRFLKVNACLDPLRSDPRFNELVSRVGSRSD